MGEFQEESLLRRTLYHLREVAVPVPGGGRLGPIDWVLPRGKRFSVVCEEDAHWEVLSELLTGKILDFTGSLEEIETVTVQTDANLWESMDLNQSIRDFLHSPDAPDYVRLENRRHALWVLIDRLGLTARDTRRPLKLESEAVRIKYWALRFMVSRAELLLGRSVFASEDPEIREAIAARWSDFPGTLVIKDEGRPLPGPVDGQVVIDRAGRVRVA